MTRRLAPIVAAVAALLSVPAPAPAAEPGRVMIVYDASGSMWGQIEDRAKVEIAREVLAELLADWNAERAVGLTAYGHRRKGDCGDIEVLVPAEAGGAAKVAAAVGEISPKGKTPLSEAVRRAAEALRHTEERATVILISDGEETCDADPCAVGAELAMTGVDFTAHVIGFDVSEEERQGLECLARRTGGLFLAADDAAQLEAALERTVKETVAAEEEPEVEPGEATLEAPDEVPAGSDFEVRWTGPDGKNDFVTVVEAEAKEGSHGDYDYTRQGSPLTLRAPDTPGSYELRYVFFRGRLTLASRPIQVVPVLASLAAPDSVVAGAAVEVSWTGPDNRNDYVTIVRPDAREGAHDNYAYTRRGNPLEVLAPVEPGEWEIRYVTGQDKLTLARRPLEVEAAAASLAAPDEVDAGSHFQVEWTGPDNKNDYVTIVATGTPEGKHGDYAYTRNGDPAEVRAPDEPGEHELRYVTGQDRKTLARIPIEVAPVGATLEVPEKAPAGSDIQVSWEGPDNKNDYITVVTADTAEGKHGNYTYTREGNPLELRLPESTGTHEVRYVMGQSRSTLASTTIELFQISATLDAPEEATAGGTVEVRWTGPGNKNDYVTIVEVGTPEGKHGKHQYTRRGEVLSIRVPEEPGDYELRYVTGQDKKTLARRPLRVVE